MAAANKVAQGILIILKYDPKAQTDAEHDVIYCGVYSRSAPLMTPDDLQAMDDLGWFQDERNDSWMRYT